MAQPFSSSDTTTPVTADCSNPIASLVEMFVGIVQANRIAAGQCPALRPVFLKPHGVAHGVFRVLPDLPAALRVGIFAGTEYPAWVRLSSDTLPSRADYGTTVGIGIKLFDVPGPKIVGAPDDTTFDVVLQNFDVFFVNTAKDMCEFTRAGVVEGDYEPYLKAHPETARLLDEMAAPVGSTLGISYWSGVPFAFGPHQFVKYKLEPTITVPPPATPPADPTYLGADLEARLKAGEARFRFCIQLRTDPATMPLDAAMVPWSEAASPPIPVAELILPAQDISVRGQRAYGENLSWNIWRVTDDHRPQGSIADARRVVYEASAAQRRNVNGVPTGEPDAPRPAIDPAPGVDRVVVRAAIHPGIGVCRIGDSATEYYIGPEVTHPAPLPPGSYRDATGALKREAARFRVYGYNAAGDVVGELTADSANIVWHVHLANRKAAWYQFQAALDIPDAVTMAVPRRNAAVPVAERNVLVIDPGERRISGASVSGGPAHRFDTGTFKGVPVPLGEIRTDDAGRLLVLGGLGASGSPSGAPVYDPADPNSFNNADDWYDDISDGPVTATVSINGRAIPVEPAWVVCAPPNYAPSVVGWRTLADLLVDVYTECGWMAMPSQVSFAQDILPFLRRLSNLQWVNKGFAALFGSGGPMDFADARLVAKLAAAPAPAQRNTPADVYAELRRAVFNAFRPYDTPAYEPRLWPWLYGDAFGSFAPDSPRNNLALPSVQQALLRRWVDGDFVGDWDPSAQPPDDLAKVPLAGQPHMLDVAALHFCLADAFHPGCEMTWPMRHASLYEKPFRIRRRPTGDPEPDYGSELTQATALQPGGPVYAQEPGSLSRWMALPWQGDTAFCRSGYDPEYDPYLPAFWPARVPDQVLTEDDYRTVMDTSRPREARLAAFNNRAFWTRGLKGTPPEQMMQMVADFQAMGLVEARPGIPDDPDFPPVIFVESVPADRVAHLRVQAKRLSAPAEPPSRVHAAGWESEAQLQAFRRIRVRFQR